MLVEFSKILKKLDPDALLAMYEPIISIIKTFEKEYSHVIQQQDFLFDNLAKNEFLKNPKHKLYLQGNNGKSKTIVAKVNFPFYFKGKKSKKNINVFLGTTKKYPNGIEDEQLIKDAPITIREYFANVTPDFDVDVKLITKHQKELILYRYWKEKLIELQLRTEPVFTIARSANANKVNIYVANVKWGYKTLMSKDPKKYLSCYLGVAKNYREFPKHEEVRHIVKEYIKNKAPLVNDIPLK